jgi:hypothetical protein
VDLFQTLAAEGSRSLQAALLETKSLRFNLLLQEYQMTDLIKALRERREELRNELQAHPSFQEYLQILTSSCQVQKIAHVFHKHPQD